MSAWDTRTPVDDKDYQCVRLHRKDRQGDVEAWTDAIDKPGNKSSSNTHLPERTFNSKPSFTARRGESSVEFCRLHQAELSLEIG